MSKYKYRETVQDIRDKIKKLTPKSKCSTLAITCYAEHLAEGEQRLYDRIRDIRPDDLEIIAIRHDQGEDREHWHILIRIPDGKRRAQVSTVLKRLGIAFRPGLDDALLAQRALETCGDYTEYATYLLHRTVKARQDGKASYEASDFVTNLSSSDIDSVLRGYTPTKRRLNARGIATLIDATYDAGYHHKSYKETVSGYYIHGMTPQQRKKFEDSYKKGARDSLQSNPRINRIVIEIEYPRDAPPLLKDKIRYAAESSFDADYRIALPADDDRVEYDELTDAIIIPDYDVSSTDGDWTARFEPYVCDRVTEIKPGGRRKARLWCGSIFLIVHEASDRRLENSFYWRVADDELKLVRAPKKAYDSEKERDLVADILRRFVTAFNKLLHEYSPEEYFVSLDDILSGDGGQSRDIRINFVDGAHTGVTGDNISGVEGPVFNGVLDGAPTGYAMLPRFVGYDAQASAVTLDIVNSSASTDRIVAAAFSGDCFDVEYGAGDDGTAVIPASGHRGFIITPKEGLHEDKYRDTLFITGECIEPIKFNVGFEVMPRIYSFRMAYSSKLEEAQNLRGKNGKDARTKAWAESRIVVRDAVIIGGIKFEHILEGSDASINYITMENTGNSPLRDVTVAECTVSGADVGPQDCMLKIRDIGGAESRGLLPGASAQYRIDQKDGIAAGTYESAIKIAYHEGSSDEDKTVIVPVSFVILKKLVGDIKVSVSDLILFDEIDENGMLVKSMKKTITITNGSEDGEENALMGLSLSHSEDCSFVSTDKRLYEKRVPKSFKWEYYCDFLRPGESISFDLCVSADSNVKADLFVKGENMKGIHKSIQLF